MGLISNGIILLQTQTFLHKFTAWCFGEVEMPFKGPGPANWNMRQKNSGEEITENKTSHDEFNSIIEPIKIAVWELILPANKQATHSSQGFEFRFCIFYKFKHKSSGRTAFPCPYLCPQLRWNLCQAAWLSTLLEEVKLPWNDNCSALHYRRFCP